MTGPVNGPAAGVDTRAGRRGWRRAQRGASLAEVLVAVSILAIGGAAATQLLVRAAHDLDGAELGLRAVLLLAEVERDGPPPDGDSGPASEVSGPEGQSVIGRPAGPGRLTVEWENGWPSARYDPPPGAATGSVGAAGRGGYQEAREWKLRGDP